MNRDAERNLVNTTITCTGVGLGVKDFTCTLDPGTEYLKKAKCK